MESVTFWVLWALGMLISTVLGAYAVKKHRDRGYMIFSTMLAIYIVSANILVPRLVTFHIFGVGFALVTGSIIWPYTSQLTDMINEIYGKKATYLSAAVAYVANLMFVVFVLMAFQLKPLTLDSENFFKSFFAVAGRVLLASTCSYIASNYVDIKTFSWVKNWAIKREEAFINMILLSSTRSAVSDAISMVVDNLVFYTIAFYGTMPTSSLLGIIGSSMLAKVILSQVDLPFFWLFKTMTQGIQRDT